MFFVIALVLVLASSLFSLMWVQRDEIAFLRSLSGVTLLEQESFHWAVYAGTPGLCNPADFDHCRANIGLEKPVFSGEDLYGFDLAPYLDHTTPGSFTFLHFRTVLSRAAWAEVKDGDTVVVNLYPFQFDTAAAYLNGVRTLMAYNNGAFVLKFKNQAALQRDLNIELTLALPGNQKKLLTGNPDSVLLFVAPESRYKKYEEMAAANRSGQGKQLADIARIVLGVFCLLLFIFVDSSPESLGLCVFMGLKATGVIFAQNWLPESWLAQDSVAILRGTVLCFGDIIELYFFTQLARVMRPNLKLWFAVGLPLAIGYAFATLANFKGGGIEWSAEIWRWRNVLIGLGCWSIALPSAVYLFHRRLYYRSAALFIAFCGTLVQVFYPLGAYFPGIFEAAWFKTFYNVMETQTPYVFALSTFINLTTLENRVKALSREVISAKEIEREMALGKTVQQSFLRIPEVPPEVEVQCQHEAAVYVSGDIYFVHWDEGRRTVTMLINDVTGHGVQAALKASICSTIADSIWNEKQTRSDDAGESRFRTYDMRLHSFLSKVANESEVLALVGAEYNLAKGTLSLYRVNGIFPILIEPRDEAAEGDRWRVSVAPLKNRELTTVNFSPGSFVLLISDGYIGGSRTMAHFQAYLAQAIARESRALSAAALKSAALSFPDFTKSGDDKTLLVLKRTISSATFSAQPAA